MDQALNLGKVIVDSLRVLFQPRMLLIIFLPFVVSVLIWSFAGYVLWQIFEPLLLNFGEFLAERLTTLASMAEWFSVTSVVAFFGLVALLLLIVPLMWITALVLTSLLAMPLIVRLVHGQSYSQIEKRGKTDLRFWIEFTKLSLAFLFFWLVSLFFLLLPGIGFLVPLSVTAYFHYRIVLIDAMSDFASREEFRLMRHKYRTEALSLGLLSAVLLSTPVVNFISPVISAILFTNFGFAALQNLRKTEHNQDYT